MRFIRIEIVGLHMAKTAAFGGVHLGVAFGVGYALTGSVATAGALTVVEPLCNMVAHFFFDRWWERRGQGRQAAPQRVAAPVAAVARDTVGAPPPPPMVMGWAA